VRALIVNADDFGLTRGVNRGIAEAHRRGVLTSTSLLVDTPFSEDAAALIADLADLSVGLHADLPAALVECRSDRAGIACIEELERQFERFRSLTRSRPAHLDSHRNVHRRDAFTDAFVQVGLLHGVPVREHSDATYVSSFYGQWAGATHAEQINLGGLERILRSSEGELIELACHPGYCDDTLRSSYRAERETELRTLCDERLSGLLAEIGFVLVNSCRRARDRSRRP
jgi:predicted glycoside hydrolase/deacetylase ChbG (UPF0249 family)